MKDFLSTRPERRKQGRGLGVLWSSGDRKPLDLENIRFPLQNLCFLMKTLMKTLSKSETRDYGRPWGAPERFRRLWEALGSLGNLGEALGVFWISIKGLEK